ncbi:MAG: radical SAM protein [Thermodesulfobacteriota bacterium]
MGECKLCQRQGPNISKELGVCLSCLRHKPEEAYLLAEKVHKKSRAVFGLPEKAPQDPQGIPCALCVNECRLGEGQMGYCGLRQNIGGKIMGVSAKEGKLSWYYDPLPTNCVADWVCAGGTGAGFPKFAHFPGPERGYKNLAVFFHACSFNCLYCQNWQFKKETFKSTTHSLDELVAAIDERTSCLCYFGGDPIPQLTFSLHAGRKALTSRPGKILRICWETNGSMAKGYLEEMIDLALISGGCIKFDLKAWDENLHKALTGVSNQRTLQNFQYVAEKIKERPEPPLLVASTLLVPGYIDEQEVRALAKFIAALNPEIPYALLGFYPHFYFKDMPLTKREDAFRCLIAAQEEGLTRVRLGNIHLLRG